VYAARSGLLRLCVRSRGDVLRFASHLPLATLCRAFGAWLFGRIGDSEIVVLGKIRSLDRVTSGRNLQGMDYREYITIDPNKRGGKPCVRGLRITVYEVLEYLASDMTEEEILADFPDLTREDFKACIAFAADRERKLMTVPAA